MEDGAAVVDDALFVFGGVVYFEVQDDALGWFHGHHGGVAEHDGESFEGEFGEFGLGDNGGCVKNVDECVGCCGDVADDEVNGLKVHDVSWGGVAVENYFPRIAVGVFLLLSRGQPVPRLKVGTSGFLRSRLWESTGC